MIRAVGTTAFGVVDNIMCGTCRRQRSRESDPAAGSSEHDREAGEASADRTFVGFERRAVNSPATVQAWALRWFLIHATAILLVFGLISIALLEAHAGRDGPPPVTRIEGSGPPPPPLPDPTRGSPQEPTPVPQAEEDADAMTYLLGTDDTVAPSLGGRLVAEVADDDDDTWWPARARD